ncbi:hypothetical protein [uncultured Imperialibacter sp.]|uniref:hypothetical protein n=1 Tax=uncultured Imperialibacter sp. TaxID=1672639 RepID=UPI0030D9F2E2|tara:strand:+ start:146 stop:721 length:576 start_codon:yes stop_codon:yes gene_type:complete
MKKILTTDEQISKLQEAMTLAERAAKSQDIATRLGALVLNAGMVDFLVIQAARLFEEIILKGQLAQGNIPTFKPSPDTHFYDHKISTGGMLKGMRKLLPFNGTNSSDTGAVGKVNELANNMIDTGFQFLDCRNPIIHHIGNPNKEFKNIVQLCDQANKKYLKFQTAHKEFMELAGPYRFGQKEVEYFFGNG